jgi:hypothetical protein
LVIKGILAMICLTILAAAMVGVPTPASPADAPNLTGNWLLTFQAPPGLLPPMGRVEFHTCIIHVDQKDGVPTASVLASPPNLPVPVTISDFKLSGNNLSIRFQGGESIFLKGGAFTGSVVDPKLILGSISGDLRVFRAQLARTEEKAIKISLRLADYPEPLLAAWKLELDQSTARYRAANEKDPEKKKMLRAQVEKGAKELDEKEANLFRETIEKHADSPFALDAAALLIKSAAERKLSREEVTKLITVVKKVATPYGKQYLEEASLALAESLAYQKEFAGMAADLLQPIATQFPADIAATHQARVLTTYKIALAGVGKEEEAKAVDMRLAKLESKLDEEYLAAVPPFKPAAFGGRKEKSANRIAVVELFTGAECKPCIAADVAFDAMAKAYKPTDVVLLQYHLHIPGPDPLTNPATEARAAYYKVQGTPTCFFNGKRQATGGGSMDAAESRYGRFVQLLAPFLEEQTSVKLAGHAKRAGDELTVTVDASGLEPGGEARLRLFIVEEAVRYVGGNRMRFHHHVVRAMPGGPEGVAVKEATFKQTLKASVATLRKDLSKYLDEYASNVEPFRTRSRPQQLKELKVVALIQDDKTKNILQAVQLDLDDESAP